MPHLICIGAQRAATTWLYRKLRNAFFDISDISVKEVHYFNQVWIPEQRSWCINHRLRQAYDGIDYLTSQYSFEQILQMPAYSQFLRRLMEIYSKEITDDVYRHLVMVNHDKPHRLSLDFTPEYALLPREGFVHMNSVCPNAHYTFILRNPIQRAYSHLLKLNKDEGLDLRPESIAEYIDTHPDIVARSDYKDTIDNFLSVIDKSRLTIILQDDIVNKPLEVLRTLSFGLNLRPTSLNMDDLELKEHVSQNTYRYPNSDLSRLKEILWDRFSCCYNKIDDLGFINSASWRHDADVFLDRLADE